MKKMKKSVSILLILVLSAAVFYLGVRLGSVKNPTPEIIEKLRLPRAALAFLVGACLSVSGAAVQGALKNPLASPFTLGVSSGASLGAAAVIFFSLNFFGEITLPLFGSFFAVGTIFLMVALTKTIDKTLESSTAVLMGMVLSLFISAAVSLIANISEDKYTQITRFAAGQIGRSPIQIAVLSALLFLCGGYIFSMHRPLDIMTFGDETSRAVGLDTPRAKSGILIAAAVLSGAAVSFCGVIGFVDLICPHIVRKIFGPSHKTLLPMSALVGGTFTVLCDLLARTVIPPAELPVGVITSLVGAPFFAAVFFGKRRRG
jgi:iron complex transport system permease protein